MYKNQNRLYYPESITKQLVPLVYSQRNELNGSLRYRGGYY